MNTKHTPGPKLYMRHNKDGSVRQQSMQEHTPGPWRTIGYQSVQDARGMEIAWCTVSMQFGKEPAEILTLEAKANARLITAAPDGLSANIKARDAILDLLGSGLVSTDGSLIAALRDAMNECNAAIAKATGNTNL